MQFGRRNGRRFTVQNQSPTHYVLLTDMLFSFYAKIQIAF